MSDDLDAQVTEMLIGFRAEWADSGAPTYAANIIRTVREAIAAEIETAGEAAQVEYDKCEAFHALSPMTCSRLSEARFCARLVRRGEQQ